MQRTAAGLLMMLALAGCQPTDARLERGASRAGVYGATTPGRRTGEVSARLEQILFNQRAPAYVRAPLWHLIRAAYDRRQYAPLWVGAGAPERAAALVAAVCRAEVEGLRSADYSIDALAAGLEALGSDRAPDRLAELDLLLTGALIAYGQDLVAGRVTPASVAPEWRVHVPVSTERLLERLLAAGGGLESELTLLRPRAREYEALMPVLRRLREIEAAGGWPEVPDDAILRRGVAGASVDALRRRLAVTGELAPGDSATGRPFDARLADAVARFQRSHGLSVDGIAGESTIAALNVPAELRIAQVEATLERYRWLPGELLPRYALVDLAGGRLTGFAGGAAAVEMAASASDSVRLRLPPAVADTITAIRSRPGDSAGGLGFALAHAGGVSLHGRGGAGGITIHRPLELAALAAGRDTAAVRAALRGGAAGGEITVSLPVFVLNSSVRQDDGETRFSASVPVRDSALAEALGPAQLRGADECRDLSLGAASALLSGS